jgi:DNA repair exonuclease SbcCD nuclease subunit
MSIFTFKREGSKGLSIKENVIAKILFLADTHLGFDLPLWPRIERRRRGPDFFANYLTALQPAFKGKVDIVVHGGDLLYRSRVPASLVEMALDPLVRVAEKGIPVFLIPGNHERGKIPLHLWARHPNLHIFDQPKTFTYTICGKSLSFSGFPYRRNIESVFKKALNQTGYKNVAADIRFLCIHQAIEGAQVGIMNYIFRKGPDVISGADIPGDFVAVLSGHIHRAQKITHCLNHKPLAALVIYPGSVERTSFVEREEVKKYVILKIDSQGSVDVQFIPLKTRRMINLIYEAVNPDKESVIRQLQDMLRHIDADAVVRIQIKGKAVRDIEDILSAQLLRSIAPPTMNISLAVMKREDI